MEPLTLKDLEAMNYRDLQVLAKNRSLKATGKRADLEQRLLATADSQAGEEDQNENTNERSPVAPKTPKRCKPPTTPAASLVKAFGSLSLNTPRATQTRYHTRSSARKANKLVDSVVVSTLRDSSNNHQDSGVQITTAAAGAEPPGSHIPAPPLAETDDGELVAARLGDTTSEAATPTVRNLDVSVSPPRSPNVYPLEPDTAIRPVQKPSLLELPADKEGASQAKQLFSSSPTTIANAAVQETPSSLEAAVEGQNDPANDEAAGEGEGYKEELEVKSRGLPECAKDSAPRPSVAVTAGGGSDSAARDAATADVDVAGANVIAGVASATAAVTPSHLIAAKDGAKSACVKLFTDNPEQDEAEQVEGRGTQSHRNGNAAVGGMGSHEGMDGDDTVIHIEGDETTGRSASSAECEEDPVTFNQHVQPGSPVIEERGMSCPQGGGASAEGCSNKRLPQASGIGMDTRNLVAGSDVLEFTEDEKRVLCTVTGQEIVPDCFEILKYLGSKRVQRLLKEGPFNIEEFADRFIVEDPVDSNLVHCELTGVTLNKNRAQVMKHVNGQQYKLALQTINADNDSR